MKNKTNYLQVIKCTLSIICILFFSLSNSAYADDVISLTQNADDVTQQCNVIVKGKIIEIETISKSIQYDAGRYEEGEFYSITISISEILKDSSNSVSKTITFIEPIHTEQIIYRNKDVRTSMLSTYVPSVTLKSGYDEYNKNGSELIFFLTMRIAQDGEKIFQSGNNIIYFSEENTTCTFHCIYTDIYDITFKLDDMFDYFDFGAENTDLPPEWLHGKMDTLKAVGIIQGYDNGIIKPYNFITREEFTAILGRIFGFGNILTQEAPGCTFEDVSVNDWFYPYVSVAQELGLVEGIGNHRFGSGQYITRQDMTTLTARVMQQYFDINLPDIEKAQELLNIFNDYSNIKDYAAPAIAKFVEDKIVNGYSVNFDQFEFRPNNYITRAEACQILYPIWIME